MLRRARGLVFLQGRLRAEVSNSSQHQNQQQSIGVSISDVGMDKNYCIVSFCLFGSG